MTGKWPAVSLYCSLEQTELVGKIAVEEALTCCGTTAQWMAQLMEEMIMTICGNMKSATQRRTQSGELDCLVSPNEESEVR